MPIPEEKAKDIVNVAAQIARAQGGEPEATVLGNCIASLIFDGEDYDVSLYTLTLEIPIQTYANIEQYREGLEQSIRERIRPIARRYPDSRITQVIITPELSPEAHSPAKPEEQPQQPEDAPSFWKTGFFRLFISHTHPNKLSAHNLKTAVGKYGIAAFVAHDDIEPTKEWQLEIERALRTADALAAIITPDFVDSRWCDQEVGFAFGRGKLVIPLCKETVPHGFLGKYQGFPAKGLQAPEVAEQLFQILLNHSLTSGRMADALVENMAQAGSFQAARDAMPLLERLPKLTPTQVARLMQSVTDNDQVAKAIRVPERIRALISRVG
jgi:TIR domain-containing protein